MARQKLKVTYTDGRVLETKITPKVEVAVEKQFKVGLQSLQGDAHAEHFYYMAWAGLHYAGQEGKSFEDFLDALEDVEPIDQKKDEAEDDPFIVTPQPDSLSS